MARTTIQTREAARRRELIFDALCRAADAGTPCPLTPELAEIAGVAHATVRVALRRLHRDGRIVLKLAGHLRIVTICATGKTTAAPPSPARDAAPPRPKVTVGEIIELAAVAFDTTAKDIRSSAKFQRVVRPRQAACAVAVRHGWSVSHIARVIGRDHSTVCHSRDIAPVLERFEPQFAQSLARLDAAVRERAAA